MIPNKSSFKFQELTPITGVKPYVIRFWEAEFPEIAPMTSDSGQKVYSRKDLEVILKIKKLLFEDKLTIPEAKHRISSLLNENELPSQAAPNVHQDLEALKSILNNALGEIKDIKLRRNW